MPNHTEKQLCKWSSHQNDLPTLKEATQKHDQAAEHTKTDIFLPEFAAPNSAARFGTTSAMAPKNACSDKASCAKAQAVPERP